MASFKILSETPERMVLGKGGGNVVGTLIGVAVFGVVACVGLVSILDQGGELDPVMIVIFIVIGLVVLSSFANVLSSTRVVLDSNQRTATRTSTLGFIPMRRQEMAFNLIRDVRVARGGHSPLAQSSLDAFPVWQVELRATDGSTLGVNERGTRGEMDALAQKVATLLGRPVRADTTVAQTAAEAPTPTIYAPAGMMGSLYENLISFAQSAAESGNQPSLAPTISAYPSSGTRPPQDAMEPTARGRRKRRAASLTPAPNTFSATTEAMNPETPYMDASASLAAQQASGEPYNALSLPSVAFSAPPVLAMPEMPALFSFASALDMPTFPPLGGATIEPTVSPTSTEFKQVEIEVSPSKPSYGMGTGAPPASPPDAIIAQLNTARQMLAAHKFRDAEGAFLRVLNMNPADASVQHDLGVVFLEENKLQDAERAFRRAIALEPGSNASRYNLGVALSRMGRQSEANEQFKTGAQHATRNDESYFRDALRGVLRAPLLSQPA